MFKIKIKDIEWKVILLEDKDFDEKYEDTEGATERGELEIYFKKSGINKNTILHELMHAYVASCHVNSLPDLTHEQMEELCAEIIEYHIHDILRKSSYILKKLQKLKK